MLQAEKLKWAGVEMKGDTWTYLGLGLGAVGLVVTVVGLGDKVRIVLHKGQFLNVF